ncbi:MAG: universal stress protein [Pseudomonadota bacterium]
MSAKLVVGLDGSGSGQRAVAHAKRLANLIGDCELVLLYVIEWSPFTFQTAEENEQRHKRREEEITAATTRVVEPAVTEVKAGGFKVRGLVRHGDVADLLNRTATEEGAEQIIVARTSETGIASRIFGSSTANLVMSATVPVTVVS